MKSKIKQVRFYRGGSILVLAAIILVILASLGIGMLATAYGVRHRAIQLKNEATAMLAAEAGYEEALYEMGKQKDMLSALQKSLPGTSGTLSFPDGSCDYEIGLSFFCKARPVYKVTSIGHSGVFSRTVDVYVIQAIPGWAMGMCRVPYGASTTGKVVFAKGEIIDMPVHINDRKDSPDYRDIHIQTGTPRPRFLERVAMGESKYRASGADKPGEDDSRDYDDLMPIFEEGIYFKQPDCRITDKEAMDLKLERFKDSTNEQFIFTPQKTDLITNPQAAVQLEFFVEGGVGKVRITNNCTVLGYRRDNDSKSWDFKITPGTNPTQFERYYIYAYHYKPNIGEANYQVVEVPLEQTYVTQSFGGVESEPGGQIFVEGNVVIGGHNAFSPDQFVQGTVAVVATGNIWIADNVRVYDYDDAGNYWPRGTDGKPAMENPNAIGLIANGVVKVIDPGMSSYTSSYTEFGSSGGNNNYPGSPLPVTGYEYARVAHQDPVGAIYDRYLDDQTVVEAAVTVGGGGWGAENVARRYTSDNKYYGGRKEDGTQDNLILRGAITECLRGVVGLTDTDGYLKYYYLDARLLEGILPGDIWLQGKYVATPAGWHDYRL